MNIIFLPNCLKESDILKMMIMIMNHLSLLKISKRALIKTIRPKSVVFTTGATCNEAILELLKNGAGRVDALVLART